MGKGTGGRFYHMLLNAVVRNPARYDITMAVEGLCRNTRYRGKSCEGNTLK